MGAKPSRVGLNEQDLETLHRISEKKLTDIVAWYDALKAECPSGRLDKRQFLKSYTFFSDQLDPNVRGALADQCFNAFDMDKDGTVDLGEFLAVYVIMNGDADAEQKLRYVFDMYDQDNNGYIDAAELRVGLRAMFKLRGVAESNNCVQKIMAYLDENKDGRINKEEFLDGLLSDPYLVKYVSPYY